MKQKLFNILKPLLASKGLSKEEVEGLADIGAKNLTETSTDVEIENVANGLVPYAELMQKSGNRLVTAVETKYRGFVDPASLEEKYKGFVDPATLEKYNEWLKEGETKPKGMTNEEISALIQKGIEDGLKPFREKEEHSRLNNLLATHAKVKDIPESFRKHYSVEKEDDIESVATQIENEYATFKQELIRTGQFMESPKKGNGDTIDDDIQLLKNMVESAQK